MALWLLLVLVGVGLTGAGLVVLGQHEFRILAGWLYRGATELGGWLSAPVNALRLQTGPSMLTPFLLGLMGAVAPCQLSSGAAALAYVLRNGRDGQPHRRAAAYLLAHVLVYLVGGGLILALVEGAMPAPAEFFVGVRRVLGPLTLLSGLVMLGVVRWRWVLGVGLAGRLQAVWARRGGFWGAFALGLAFSFSFCPTLFLLFFGLTLPLALTAPWGALYPALFALGMSVPLLILAGLIPARGAGNPAARARRLGRLITPLAGVAFVLTGLFDTFVYWFM
ncbi:sulfite exporter TauE/SafE family protein [Deinococcus yunweiensis]|uniref:urease accessory protein UreH domain-containing protein n=1 Tax=Deinococcus yunweiensis TaxID=367282 RepID=UPI00398F0288